MGPERRYINASLQNTVMMFFFFLKFGMLRISFTKHGRGILAKDKCEVNENAHMLNCVCRNLVICKSVGTMLSKLSNSLPSELCITVFFKRYGRNVNWKSFSTLNLLRQKRKIAMRNVITTQALSNIRLRGDTRAECKGMTRVADFEHLGRGIRIHL